MKCTHFYKAPRDFRLHVSQDQKVGETLGNPVEFHAP